MCRIVCNLRGLYQPWNCPHGRPTLRHLLSLDDVTRNLARVERDNACALGAPGASAQVCSHGDDTNAGGLDNNDDDDDDDNDDFAAALHRSSGALMGSVAPGM